MKMKNLFVGVISFTCALAHAQFGAQQVITTVHPQPAQVLIGDMDYDGDLDFAVSGLTDYKSYWYSNNGSGTFTLQQTYAPNYPAVSPHFVDLNGDGFNDLLAGTSDGSVLFWCENDGNGIFAAPQIIHGTSWFSDVSPADFDNDGDMDLVYAETLTSNTECGYIENLGAGAFANPVVVSSLSGGAHRIEAVDLNQDGNTDVLLGTSSDGKVHWLPGMGNGNFGAKLYVGDCSIPNPYVADHDLDGDLDVFCGDSGAGTVELFVNNGSQQFNTQQVLSNCVSSWEFTTQLSDLDSDGDLDVLSSCNFGGPAVNWYENQGGGVFSNPITITNQVVQPKLARSADFDGDGDLDVISVSDSLVAWYENLGGGMGVSEFSEPIVSMTPNPASDVVRISLGEQPITSVAICNVQGKFLLFETGLSSGVLEIDVTGFETGFYTVAIRDQQDQYYSERLLIY